MVKFRTKLGPKGNLLNLLHSAEVHGVPPAIFVNPASHGNSERPTSVEPDFGQRICHQRNLSRRCQRAIRCLMYSFHNLSAFHLDRRSFGSAEIKGIT